jgi:hypothetical protein
MHLQQSPSEKLLLHLPQLHSRHARSERRNFGVCLLTQRHELRIIRPRPHRFNHSLLQNGKVTVELFKRHGICVAQTRREFAQSYCDR